MEWFEAVKAVIDRAATDPSNPAINAPKVSGDQAMKLLFSASSLSQEAKSPLVVEGSDPLIQAKWIVEQDLVSVTPTYTGRLPQYGRLVGLTAEKVSIEIQVPKSDQTFVAHFPRIGYTIQREKGGNDTYARM
jgi:hypothetical protein